VEGRTAKYRQTSLLTFGEPPRWRTRSMVGLRPSESSASAAALAGLLLNVAPYAVLPARC
jgi:hypothetical protein